MSPSSTRYESASPPRSSGARSPSAKKSRTTSKDVDWTEVTDPEERRRIQNRIAQRKFREKARENKEKAEREARNQENAGNSYRIPSSNDFMNDVELSGLPWGSVNIGLSVARGHESQGRPSSGRGTYVGDDTMPPTGAFGSMPFTHGFPQTASYGSSGADEMYVDEPAYTYSPVLQPFPTA